MPFSATFSGVRLPTGDEATKAAQPGSVVVVEGRTQPSELPLAIHIAIPREQGLFVGKAKSPQHESWAVAVEVEPPFRAGDDVSVFGIAERADREPFFWQGGFVLDDPVPP